MTTGHVSVVSLLFWPVLSLVISGTQYVHGHYPYQKVRLCPSDSDLIKHILEGTVDSVEQPETVTGDSPETVR